MAAGPANFSEPEQLSETLDVLNDPNLMEQFRKSQAFYKTGKKGLAFEKIFSEALAHLKKSRRK